MKKLVFTYVGFVLVIIIVSTLLSFKKTDKHKVAYTLNLPETISVYYKEDGVCKETDFEEYVICVVSAEVPGSFHEEAIKAQAVAARHRLIVAGVP